MPFDFNSLPEVDSGRFWKLTNVGDSLNGTLVAVKWVLNKGMAGAPDRMVYRYYVQQDSGEVLMCNATALDRKLEFTEVGQYVSIVFNGKARSKTGIMYNDFKVKSAPGAVNEEWLKKNVDRKTQLDARLRSVKDEDDDEESMPTEEAFKDNAPKKDPLAEFNADLDKTSSPAEKQRRIIDLAILKLGAKTPAEAQVKAVMQTGMPFTDEYFDRIITALEAK